MAFVGDADYSSCGDEELIRRLRTDGDAKAYEMLWRRHIGVVLELARRMTPTHADDLASEAFAAVHHNIVVADVGPTEAFRPYIVQVMRNIAAQWRRDGDRFVNDAEIEEINDLDGLHHVERSAERSLLLDAFQALPERWQRVLWLSEVENIPRPQLAAEMRLSPNAVSVLRRRARAGLRVQWLMHHVPVAFREDQRHVARLLPAMIGGTATRVEKHDIRAHLTSCDDCVAIERELRELIGRNGWQALSFAGFAALSVGGGIATNLVAPAVTATAVVSLIGAGAAAIAGAAVVGGVIIGVTGDRGADPAEASTRVETFAAPAPRPVPDAAVPSVAAEPPAPKRDETASEDAPVPPIEFRPGPSDAAPIPKPVLTPPPPAEAGTIPVPGKVGGADGTDPQRGVNGTTPDLATGTGDLGDATPGDAVSGDGAPADGAPDDGAGPVADDPAAPDTGTDTGEGSPDASDPPSPGSVAAPAVTMSAPDGPYLAPQFAGTTTAGSQVAVEVDGATYPASVDDAGAWSYDLRRHYLPAGTHDARVWAYRDDVASEAESFSFEVVPLGIEGLEPTAELDVNDAGFSPFWVTLTGPAGGTACLAHDLPEPSPEESAQDYWITVWQIPLDETGQATRSLSFLGLGDYSFDIFLCSYGIEELTGPVTSFFVSVVDSPFGGWGPALPYRYILVEE